MPIRPENRDRYPADWPELSDRIKFERAGGRCECSGECGRPYDHLDVDKRCRNRHNQQAYVTGSRVVLTTAHLNHQPEDCREENLKAMCQGCHLRRRGRVHPRAALRAGGPMTRRTHAGTAEKDAGLEGRYRVKKINDPTGKHDGCRYFVLDPQHDLLALQALKYYARLARNAGYVPLADDLDQWAQDETERAIAPRPIPPGSGDASRGEA